MSMALLHLPGWPPVILSPDNSVDMSLTSVSEYSDLCSWGRDVFFKEAGWETPSHRLSLTDYDILHQMKISHVLS